MRKRLGIKPVSCRYRRTPSTSPASASCQASSSSSCRSDTPTLPNSPSSKLLTLSACRASPVAALPLRKAVMPNCTSPRRPHTLSQCKYGEGHLPRHQAQACGPRGTLLTSPSPLFLSPVSPSPSLSHTTLALTFRLCSPEMGYRRHTEHLGQDNTLSNNPADVCSSTHPLHPVHQVHPVHALHPVHPSEGCNGCLTPGTKPSPPVAPPPSKNKRCTQQAESRSPQRRHSARS